MGEGRLREAEEFLEQAETILAIADDESTVRNAYTTLCVSAGIAASDAICCAAHGVHAQGESHQEALDLLRR